MTGFVFFLKEIYIYIYIYVYIWEILPQPKCSPMDLLSRRSLEFFVQLSFIYMYIYWSKHFQNRTWPRSGTFFILNMFVTSVVGTIFSKPNLLVTWGFIIANNRRSLYTCLSTRNTFLFLWQSYIRVHGGNVTNKDSYLACYICGCDCKD